MSNGTNNPTTMNNSTFGNFYRIALSWTAIHSHEDSNSDIPQEFKQFRALVVMKLLI